MKNPISRAPALSAGTGSAIGAIKSFITLPSSHAHIPVLHVGGARQFRRGAAPDDPAPLDEIMPVGDAGEHVDVLVDQQDGKPGALELPEASPDLGADQRREPLGR